MSGVAFARSFVHELSGKLLDLSRCLFSGLVWVFKHRLRVSGAVNVLDVISDVVLKISFVPSCKVVNADEGEYICDENVDDRGLLRA